MDRGRTFESHLIFIVKSILFKKSRIHNSHSINKSFIYVYIYIGIYVYTCVNHSHRSIAYSFVPNYFKVSIHSVQYRFARSRYHTLFTISTRAEDDQIYSIACFKDCLIKIFSDAKNTISSSLEFYALCNAIPNFCLSIYLEMGLCPLCPLF